VNKVCHCIIFIGPDNVQYTSKPSGGLYTVSQNLAQSKGVLSNEVTVERCSSMFNVNALVSWDSAFRLLQFDGVSRQTALECLPPLTFYSR
jgi:hypothetical protein